MRSVLLSFLLLVADDAGGLAQAGPLQGVATLRPLVRECVETVGHEVGVGHRGVGRELSRKLPYRGPR